MPIVSWSIDILASSAIILFIYFENTGNFHALNAWTHIAMIFLVLALGSSINKFVHYLTDLIILIVIYLRILI